MFRGYEFIAWVKQKLYAWKTQQIGDEFCTCIMTYLSNNSIQSMFNIHQTFPNSKLSKFNDLESFLRHQICQFCNVAKDASHGKNVVAYQTVSNVHQYDISLRTIDKKTNSFWYEYFLYCKQGYIESGLPRTTEELPPKCNKLVNVHGSIGATNNDKRTCLKYTGITSKEDMI